MEGPNGILLDGRQLDGMENWQQMKRSCGGGLLVRGRQHVQSLGTFVLEPKIP
jgi:hypothetical protein